jgi:hypothetical protein
MALTPKEMEQAILLNLPAKTGKTPEEWKAILSASGLKKQKEQLQFLKKKHGLGPFQAAVVVKQLEKNAGTDYSD